MRALLLDGGAENDVPTAAAAAGLAEELTARGYEVETVALRDKDIKACRGCFGCWVRTPGECVIRDDSSAILERYIAADAVVYVTPVTFGGYSSTLKLLVDRVIPILDPRFTRVRGEFHHRLRYDRYPQLLGFGTLPAPDPQSEATFKTLLARNGLNVHGTGYAEVVVGAAGPEAVRQAAARLLDAMKQEVAA